MPRTRVTPWGVAPAGVLGISTAVGAAAHWILWYPPDALVIFVAAGGALALGAVGRFAPVGAMRRFAIVPVLLSAGLIAGQLGPSRSPLLQVEGLATVRLDLPVDATGDGSASCATVAAEDELQVSGSTRVNLFADDPSAPPEVDQREFVDFSFRVGDRWRDGPVHRSDDRDLLVTVGRVEAGAPEIHLLAADDSLLDAEWTNSGGSVRFAALVADPATPAADDTPTLGGTITWSCRVDPPTAAEKAFADSTCATSTYVACRDEVLSAAWRMPGALIAVCDHPEGDGMVIRIEAEAGGEESCSAEGRNLSVRVVVRLPGG